MRLSTKGHYGMHAMMDLGVRHGQGAVLLRDLCATHGFSEKYLEQLLRLLKQAGLIESLRGARGGYWLARPPSEITIIEIVEALEGSLHQLPSMCKSDCVKSDRCAMIETWWNATEETRKVLADLTLQDLLDRQQEMDSDKSRLDFSI